MRAALEAIVKDVPQLRLTNEHNQWYDRMEGLVRERQGEAVFVRLEEPWFGRHDGFATTQESIYIGVLNGDLTLEEMDIVFPVEKFAQKGHSGGLPSKTPEGWFFMDEEWTAADGPLRVSLFHVQYLNSQPREISHGGGCFGGGHVVGYEGSGLRVVVGDELVEAYFRLNLKGPYAAYWDLLVRAQTDTNALESIQRSVVHHRRNKDLDYITVQELLGRPVPEDFLTTRHRQYIEQRNQILRDIDSSLYRIAILEAKVRRVKGGASSDEEVQTEDWGHIAPYVPTRYTSDDAVFATWGDQDKIGDLKGNITRRLQEAVKLGLHTRQERIQMDRPGKYL